MSNNCYFQLYYNKLISGINLGPRGIKEDEAEWSLLIYNLAVAKFQQKQFIQVKKFYPVIYNIFPTTH